MMQILIADDHPLFRDALRSVLSADGAARVHEAGDLSAALDAIAAAPDIDLVLLDLAMPGAHGLAGLTRLRAEHPAVPVLVVSASDDGVTMRRSLDLGAGGFVSKSAPLATIREAIEVVVSGEIYEPAGLALAGEGDDLAQRLSSLTPQQARVLSMLAEGKLNKQIAWELGVSEATIKAHVSAVLSKLNVDSRTQAVIMLTKSGMADGLSPPPALADGLADG